MTKDKIADAALAMYRDEATRSDYDDLKGTQSMDAPVLWMEVMHMCEEYETCVGRESLPSTASDDRCQQCKQVSGSTFHMTDHPNVEIRMAAHIFVPKRIACPHCESPTVAECTCPTTTIDPGVDTLKPGVINVLREPWTDVYDNYVHSIVRTEAGHYVFTESASFVREYIIGLHNRILRESTNDSTKEVSTRELEQLEADSGYVWTNDWPESQMTFRANVK